MRGSRLLQGWKELASKIHPQLPLDPKESQRLLTALTSSFRQHLDEVHPQHAEDDGKPTATSTTRRAPSHVFHGSSAVDTDRHLASVLTSPLLLKDKTVALNATSARAELIRQPGTDPLELFERYERRGAATLDVAIVCAAEVKRRLNKLSSAEQLALLDRSKPGRRLLQWVVETNVIGSAAFIETPHFIQMVVSLMIQEGSEEQLLDLLRLDIGVQSPRTSSESSTPTKQTTGRRTWKGAVSQLMMTHYLSTDPFGPANANAAIAVYLCIHDIEAQAWRSGRKLLSGQSAALQTLYNHIRRQPQLYVGADANIYDKLLTAMSSNLHGTSETSMKRFRHDMMLLYHPNQSRATALPAVELLQKLFNLGSEDQKTTYWKPLVQQVFHPLNPGMSKNMCEAMCDVVARLRHEGHHDHAGWLQGRISDQYPQFKALLSQQLHKVQHVQPATSSDPADVIDGATFSPTFG